MAEIVLGIGTSHGPLLSTPPEQWDLRAGADRVNKQHAYRGKIFDDVLTPAITVFSGNQIENVPDKKPEVSPGLKAGEKGNCPDEGAVYSGAQDLADHIIRTFMEDDFDVAQSTTLPKDSARLG